MLSRDEQRIRSLASRAEQRRRALSLSPDPQQCVAHHLR